jgi:3-methyladenine DNA glycosylase/8-oxoguanine DNA glycosylase
VRVEVSLEPRSPLRLPRPTPGGMSRGDERGVAHLIHLGDAPVLLIAEQRADGRLRLSASADSPADAELGLERARFWTGVDDDLSDFLERGAADPIIGPSVREAPWVRPFRRPMPFEVLLSAVCEQLITDERSQEIKRSIVRQHGRSAHGLRDFPSAQAVSRLAPADLQRCGLSASRAITLLAVARAVSAGRVPLLDPDRREEGWRRLRTIPGVGAWTLSILALHGQGHHDALPAGDHAYRIAVAAQLGRRAGAKASEDEVREFLAPYAPWRGLAGWHLLRTVRRSGRVDPHRDPRDGASRRRVR